MPSWRLTNTRSATKTNRMTTRWVRLSAARKREIQRRTAVHRAETIIPRPGVGWPGPHDNLWPRHGQPHGGWCARPGAAPDAARGLAGATVQSGAPPMLLPPIHPGRVRELVSSLGGVQVVVVGDAMLDKFLAGRA